MLRDLERRTATIGGVNGTRIVGHAVVFDTRSRDLGGFVEVVRQQAVERALRAGADVVALYNHDAGAVLGRTPKTLQLRNDGRGLAFDLNPAPTQAGRDVLELVARGDIAGASFGFKTVKDQWSTENGTTVRELLDIEIAEISLTAFPAYQTTDAQVAQRALHAYQARRGSRVDWLRLRAGAECQSNHGSRLSGP